MQEHIFFGICFTGGVADHFEVFTKNQRVLVLITNAFTCLFISSAFERIDAQSAAGDGFNGAERWAGLMISKIVAQFFLGKYLIQFLLLNCKNSFCNLIAYILSVVCMVMCVSLFTAGVEPDHRVAAMETAGLLFALDITVIDTVICYLQTYLAGGGEAASDGTVQRSNKASV
jgi:hypothetical protein